MPRTPNVSPVPGAGTYTLETQPPNVGAEYPGAVVINAGTRGGYYKISGGCAAALLTTLASYYTTTVVASLKRLGSAPIVNLTETGITCTVLPADTATVSASIIANLQAAGAVA